jgi:hypothetical protein
MLAHQNHRQNHEKYRGNRHSPTNVLSRQSSMGSINSNGHGHVQLKTTWPPKHHKNYIHVQHPGVFNTSAMIHALPPGEHVFNRHGKILRTKEEVEKELEKRKHLEAAMRHGGYEAYRQTLKNMQMAEKRGHVYVPPKYKKLTPSQRRQAFLMNVDPHKTSKVSRGKTAEDIRKKEAKRAKTRARGQRAMISDVDKQIIKAGWDPTNPEHQQIIGTKVKQQLDQKVLRSGKVITIPTQMMS